MIKLIIGVDSGSSAVKIIAEDEKENIVNKLILNKMPVIQAIEIFLNKYNIDKNNITKIVLTGVGKEEIEKNIYDIPTIKVDEFVAIGTGGQYLTKQKEALIVSIGTGTAFVMAKGKKYKHIGGTGVGGGTLLNLCKKIGNVNSIPDINKAIESASLRNVDLSIQDVTLKEIESLPKDTTAANFGKLNDNATENDIILGVVNMVFETIGVMAVFATQSINNKNIVIIGNVATMPYINIVLKKIEKLHNGVRFIIPKQAEFATVIGAIQSTK